MNKYQIAYKRLSSKSYKYESTDEVYKDIKTLGELVEKETPLEPINTGTEIWCKNCKEILDDDLWEYCPYCGQKVDWGNDDE